jgi:hypothetical protein
LVTPQSNFDSFVLQENMLNRFYQLLEEDLKTESAYLNEDGVLKVSKRIVEPHLFAKLVSGVSVFQQFFSGCENINKFGEKSLEYLQFHTQNISFFDKSIVLASLQNFPCEYTSKPMLTKKAILST